MSKQKIEQVIRHALWNAYGNACFYCSQPLDWNDLHIDHIIPEHFKVNQAKLDEVKKDYGLPSSFSINDIRNLVPSHSKCNIRKSGHLFSKPAAVYYLQLTANKENAIYKEIHKLRSRKDKSHLLAKLQVAMETDLISVKELSAILEAAKASNFIAREIKIAGGFEFVDAIFDSFYIGGNYQHLYDKEVLSGGIDVVNDEGKQMMIRTLREWQDAVAKGFYPLTNADIKLSSNFTDLESFLLALSKAKPPKYSFISEPWISVTDIDKLSPSILQDFEGKLKKYVNKGLSIGDLVRKGIVKRNPSDHYQVSLEFDGIETSMREQFRADFNNDGYEDILVSGWVRAIRGTLGFGFNSILSRFSDKDLLQNSK